MRQLKKKNKEEEDIDIFLKELCDELVAISLEEEVELEEDVNLSLDNYIKEVEKIAAISLEEESELLEKIKAGDQRALEKLTKANLHLVIPIAKQYQGKDCTVIDLINEGNLGLINVAQTFDPKRGIEFKSYAVLVINSFIQQAIAEHSRIIRLPRNEILGSMSKNGKPYRLLDETSNDFPQSSEKTD